MCGVAESVAIIELNINKKETWNTVIELIWMIILIDM